MSLLVALLRFQLRSKIFLVHIATIYDFLLFHSIALQTLDAPDVDVQYSVSDENVPIGAVSCVEIIITTARGAVYQPMDMEIFMPEVCS